MIPMVQIVPCDPVRLARAVPLSLWPVHVREQMERRRQGMERALRRLEDLREEMIEKLDALTVDPDLEPSLGAAEHPAHLRLGGGRPMPEGVFARSKGSADDCDAAFHGPRRSTTSDDEPMLGSPEAAIALHVRREPTKRRPARMVEEFGLDQTAWARGWGHEGEEPSLGFTETGYANGTHLFHASFDRSAGELGSDLEEQCENGEEWGRDSDAEPDVDDERDLGWSAGEWERGQTNTTPSGQPLAWLGANEEASLGSLGGTAATPCGSQLQWSSGGDGFDKEEEHDGREPEDLESNGDEHDHQEGGPE